jgi:hypothetical protein
MITSRDIAERLALIRLAIATIYHGMVQNDRERIAVLAMLEEAQDHELHKLPRENRETARRYAHKTAEVILAPCIDQGMSCAKFGLALFYAIGELIDAGLYDIESNPAFDKAMSAIISEDGTVTEFANIPRLDKSAQKHARRIVIALNSLGYFVKRREQAA